jgi:recombination protein RecT
MTKALAVKKLLDTPAVKGKFVDMLGGKRGAAFMSSISTAVSQNPSLQKCEPMSVISSAATAASMDLPINPSLGYAHIVPYGRSAQFQIGWKGFVQMAQRTGQYQTINTTPVYDGQLVERNPFTGDMTFQIDRKSDTIVGYLLYFKLINGFEKYFYMTKQEVEKHGKKYSKMYQRGKGQWVDDFDGMALKTVVKMGLSKFGILSTEMQKAVELDQGVIDEEGNPQYVDNPKTEPRDITPDQPSNLMDAMEIDPQSEVVDHNNEVI